MVDVQNSRSGNVCSLLLLLQQLLVDAALRLLDGSSSSRNRRFSRGFQGSSKEHLDGDEPLGCMQKHCRVASVFSVAFNGNHVANLQLFGVYRHEN